MLEHLGRHEETSCLAASGVPSVPLESQERDLVRSRFVDGRDADHVERTLSFDSTTDEVAYVPQREAHGWLTFAAGIVHGRRSLSKK